MNIKKLINGRRRLWPLVLVMGAFASQAYAGKDRNADRDG